jgi:F0F1-type ATP synthase membrane subunit b/b'
MTTVDLNVTLQLPEDVERKAREAGLFTGEKIGELITAEIERQRKEAAARLTMMMEQLQANFRAEYGDLTDEEAQALIDQWIDEADDEILHQDNASPQ